MVLKKPVAHPSSPSVNRTETNFIKVPLCSAAGLFVSGGNRRICTYYIAFAPLGENSAKYLCILPITFFAKMLYNKHIEIMRKILPDFR